MPTRPMKLCLAGGCHVRSSSSRCKKHRAAVLRSAERNRGNANHRGYNRKWRRAAAAWLAAKPLCGCGRMATVVDHIVPHRGDMDLFWDSDNWQTMCKGCHDRKTGKGQ